MKTIEVNRIQDLVNWVHSLTIRGYSLVSGGEDRVTLKNRAYDEKYEDREITIMINIKQI